MYAENDDDESIKNNMSLFKCNEVVVLLSCYSNFLLSHAVIGIVIVYTGCFSRICKIWGVLDMIENECFDLCYN